MNKRIEFVVGIFVLLGVLALVFLALRAGNLSTFSMQPNYTVSAHFDNIGSLKKRSAVKSNGVVVGRVKNIAFDNQMFRAIVEMDIEKQYQFPTDTSASIKTQGLIGEQYIDLTPGADDENLAQGGVIAYTQSAVVIEDLISKFLFSTADKQGSAE
ncbi:Intermembrane phospholipid transport system binding protein MlaD [Oligella urethralis]|uniref:outer membrane lipid asymmetry maintenance protein MlaD n=1 Tax=Oligella urethralis TaxID=90245 RepID=UPI00242B85A1|nr:outer membrane lipid asymmetry maintenance protein MlaD [Oligella urethralis]WOS38496.1 Intermembrane phospholipid transport system binding protein MlaD [Oligella urethralis]